MVFIVFSLACIIPLVAILSISLSNEQDILSYGYRLIPVKIGTLAYDYIFKNAKQLINAYTVTIAVTMIGMLASLAVISLLAYPLSRPDFKYRKRVSFYVIFTMLFNGGLVPWYILIVTLGLKDKLWVLILPYLANAWYTILLRTYFQRIPISFIESAKIDGSGELRTFITIVLPLSKPAIATVALFIILRYWNDWWLGLLFIESQKLVPLQLLLKRMMDSIQSILATMDNLPAGIDIRNLPSESSRMAMCILAAGPMLFVFPFFQKYFVKGLTVGGVKG
jgi:putative aldouronate transport system permease protein